MRNFDRMLPEPPIKPKLVEELEEYVTSLWPTPPVADVDNRTYKILTDYLNAYQDFANEMGWPGAVSSEHRIVAIYGRTGFCTIRCADAHTTPS